VAVHDVIDIVAESVAVVTTADLARVLRALRRREARQRRGAELTYRQIANRTGGSVTAVGEYLIGGTVPSTGRFDELIRLLGAALHELGALATARDRVVELTRSTGAVAGPVVPRMLPAAVRGFTGRSAQLARLDEQLAAVGTPGTAVISVVAGMGGVGKTALAVHWAHRVRDRFTDGQLYIDLRGYSAHAEPRTTAQALGALLEALGVSPAAMPADVPGRARLYRRLLADRRALVLLDNAANTEQVRPLLPPPSCLALVTSRDALAELVDVDGARPVPLDVLPDEEAGALLRLLVGPRAEQAPDAVRRVEEICGNLPLALRVAAEQATGRPETPLAELSAELALVGTASDLAGTVAADVRANVRAVLSWSLARLPGPAVRAFRLLGLVTVCDVEPHGLAALTGTDLAEAGHIAETLTRAHLLRRAEDGRLSMHDLLRAYARATAERELDAEQRHAAISRLLDYYLTTAIAAVAVQYPHVSRRRSRPVTEWTGAVPDVSTLATAADWLATERDNLVRACVFAADAEWPRHAVSLAAELRPFFDNGRDLDGLLVHGAAFAAASRLGPESPVELAYINFCLAVTNVRLGRIEPAAEQARQAFAEYRRTGNTDGLTMSVVILGGVYDRQGRFQKALTCHQRGLELARAGGNRVAEANQLHNLGWTDIHTEEYESALAHYQQALAIYEEIGHPTGLGEARSGIAVAYARLGRYDEALALADEALAIALDYGQSTKLVEIVATIGEIYRRLGGHRAAVEQITEALTAARTVGQPVLTALVLNTLGESHTDAAEFGRAAECHAEALELTAGSDRLEGARALLGLGDAHAGLRDLEQAHHYWRRALAEYTEMRLPSATRIAGRMHAGH